MTHDQLEDKFDIIGRSSSMFVERSTDDLINNLSIAKEAFDDYNNNSRDALKKSFERYE